MSRGVFHSTNKVGQVFSFQTNVTSGSTFDPDVSFISGSDRVSWDLGNGKLIAGNSLNYTFTGDTGTTKTIKLKTNRVSKIKQFQSGDDNIVDRLDMSKWSNLGGNFWVYDNISLTGITHTASSQVFTNYYAYNCNLTGNHDLSMFPNLGGVIYLNDNINLTGITHTASSQLFTIYFAYNCNLTGNHDLSMFPNLGGTFSISGNINLTGITHTASSQFFDTYDVVNCGLIGTHDISMFPNLGGYIGLSNNVYLTNIIHTTSTNVFNSYSAFNCNLGYINFKLFSGATFNDSNIEINDNNMSAANINHILDDFKTITVANPTKWVNILLTIGGTNQNPDSSSGGYNGLSAISTLTGSPYNWTIIY